MSILIKPTRVEFDVSNSKHRAMFFEFRRTNRWGVGGCPFNLKWPHLSVPTMCEEEILNYFAKQDEAVAA